MEHDAYAALRIPNFRWFTLSLWALTIALQIQAVVVGWQVYDLTNDPLALGIVGLAEALPFIAIALYAGHVADRMDRKLVSMIAFAALVVCSLALLGISMSPKILAGGPWPIYAVIFLTGIARSFSRPASFALSVLLVPREIYANATTWRTSTWQFGAVTGPAIGGALYALGGPVLAYATVAGLLAAGLFFFSRITSPPIIPVVDETPISESLTMGFRFLWRQPVLLGAMTLDLFSVLFGGAIALLPIFAKEILHVGPEGLGMLRAAPAAGSVLMSLFLAHRPPFRRAGAALMLNVALFGICMIAFGLSTSFALSLLVLFASGAVDNISIVIRSTLLQARTPESMLGRVSSVNAIFIGSSNEIGAFESGLAAKLMGVVPSVVFGGVMTLVVVAVTAWRVPQLRGLKEIT